MEFVARPPHTARAEADRRYFAFEDDNRRVQTVRMVEPVSADLSYDARRYAYRRAKVAQ